LATPVLQLPPETIGAEDLLVWAYEQFGDRLCLTCSWQKQSSVLVHMVSELDLPIDVIELDTQLFFRESYETRDLLVERYGLTLIQPQVITESREGGTAGIFRPSGEMRTGLVDEIAHSVDFHDLVWEAPTKASQAWFIKHFGPEVNLGNIPPEEVIPLETLRLGLRGDTLKEVLLGDPEPAAS
jgi:hypothetical protein